MEPELAQLSSTIRKAGARARDLARKGFEIQTKKDRSPVTTADLEVNRILREMQETHFPNDGWLSEESPDDPARLDKARVWIVDPIDGTKAFVNKLPEYCISVGLIQDCVPVLAAIFNPSTDEPVYGRPRPRCPPQRFTAYTGDPSGYDVSRPGEPLNIAPVDGPFG